MARSWIDEGLQTEGAREGQRRLANERRRRESSVVETQGPALMRQLVAEIADAVEEFGKKSHLERAVAFEALPHEGFRVECRRDPGTSLECRPDYAAHLIYCNMTSGEGRDDTETRELVFNLHFTVDDADRLELRHENRTFHTAEDAAEYLLTPVLFPSPDPHV